MGEEGANAVDLETVYELLVLNLPGVIYLDPAYEELGGIYVSPQVHDLLGVSPREWLGDPYCWARHVHPDDYERVWDEYCDTVAKGLSLTHEHRMIHEDGTVKTVYEQAFVIPDEDGRPFLVQGVITDITDRSSKEELSFLAYHDPLTGLPNRALFEEMLAVAVAKARRAERTLALLFVDLDNFKQVNDTMGHHAGDVLLKALAERLKPCVRDSDLLARRSGDEFLVLLDGLDMNPDHAGAAVRLVAEQIQASFQAALDLDGAAYQASASIGVSLFPHDAADGASLMKHADEAMYASKRTHDGGWLVYQGDPIEDEGNGPSLASRIRQAVEHEDWACTGNRWSS